MCGIGFIAASSDAENALNRMMTAQQHRGPDDREILMIDQDRMGLGHVRLSILDLSSAGHQPMTSFDGRYTITFNGEIYNYLELRSELTDYPFQSQTDTEVILAAYKKWGRDCLEKFIGMFAFAIWDHEKKNSLGSTGSVWSETALLPCI